ncbi:MAG: RusA family crossover junction endodeoxyribonuclease, partial [Nocardioidaceae bacterium]
IEFRFNRPKSHYGTGGNAHLVKASAPLFPTGKPDADKLLRSVFDALTAARVWRDDAQAVYLGARKVYADARPPGATILIEHHGDTPVTDQVGAEATT